MAIRDKRIDAYIKKAEPFARPVLIKLRELVHRANPEVTEEIKWGMPAFTYKGPYCGMASFKKHAVFLFWKHKLIKDPKGYLAERSSEGGEAMGNLGRITGISDLPPDRVLLDFLKQAKKLNDENIKVEKKPANKKPEIAIPDYFENALKKNKTAARHFDTFPPSARKEYIQWLLEAKTETTRENRLETAMEWISEGKRRNWKYRKN